MLVALKEEETKNSYGLIHKRPKNALDFHRSRSRHVFQFPPLMRRHFVADTHSQFFSPVLTDPGVNLRRHYVSKNLMERLFHSVRHWVIVGGHVTPPAARSERQTSNAKTRTSNPHTLPRTNG